MSTRAPDGPPDDGTHPVTVGPDEASDAAAGARHPWLGWPVGARVVVRRTVPGGWSDLLGELLRSDESGVVVRSRHGDVEVPATQIALGKVVPPPPPRRRPRDAG